MFVQIEVSWYHSGHLADDKWPTMHKTDKLFWVDSKDLPDCPKYYKGTIPPVQDYKTNLKLYSMLDTGELLESFMAIGAWTHMTGSIMVDKLKSISTTKADDAV